MATKAAYRRLTKEYQAIEKSPPPFLRARPREDNILEWHYVLQGPPDTPYEGGYYHGTVTFPPDYPYKPPAIRMSTPNGRFAPDKRICLSISDFHPATWNPSWSVATILNGLLSFMVTDELSAGTVRTSAQERRRLATISHEYNLKTRMFQELFPEFRNGPIRIDNGQADISIAKKAAALAQSPTAHVSPLVTRRRMAKPISAGRESPDVKYEDKEIVKDLEKEKPLASSGQGRIQRASKPSKFLSWKWLLLYFIMAVFGFLFVRRVATRAGEATL